MALFNARSFKINNPTALGSGCGACRLHRTCKSPRMEPYGKGEAGIMFIGKSPSQDADQQDLPFTGAPNKLLDSYLRDERLDPVRDVVKLNAVSCCLPEDRSPTSIEINNCRGRVWAAIEKFKPKVIVPFDIAALESLIGHRWPKKKDEKETGLGSYGRWFNWTIPDRQTKCWIIPNYDPQYILKTKKQSKHANQEEPPNPAAELWFERGLHNAIDFLDVPMPVFVDEEKCVTIYTDDDKCHKALSHIYDSHNFIVFDYEGSGLKPYRQGHRIWYIGIAYAKDKAIVFPTEGMKKSLRLFRQIMADRDMRKCAHNMMYEDLWTRERLGVQVEGWTLDTIQSAHILDQRPGITGLKFQTYVHTGLIDYSSHISEYLTTPLNQQEEEMGANAFNKISLAPPKQVMIYCGIDCIGTYRLAMIHANLLDIDLTRSF